MDNKPKSYINGRDEEICTSCKKQITHGFCGCNNYKANRQISYPLEEELPAVGDVVDLTSTKTHMEFTAKIIKINGVKWWTNAHGLQGVRMNVDYRIEKVIKPGKPDLKLIVGS